MQRPRRPQSGPVKVSWSLHNAHRIRTEDSLSANPPLKAVMTTSSCCFSMICGVVENIRNAFSRCAGSCDWLAWNKAPSSSGHATPVQVLDLDAVHMYVNGGVCLPSSVCWRASSATASPTFVRTDVSVSLARHWRSFARMASRSAGLSVRNRSAVWPEAALRGFDDCRLKMTAAKVRVYNAACEPSASSAGTEPGLTEVSWASSICSDRPIKSTSGLWFTHSSLSCCSAVVRWTLSGDWRPCSSVASAVCTSAGRTDMLLEF